MEVWTANPPRAAVNTQLLPKASSWIPCEPGGSKIVGGVWEAVNERRQ